MIYAVAPSSAKPSSLSFTYHRKPSRAESSLINCSGLICALPTHQTSYVWLSGPFLAFHEPLGWLVANFPVQNLDGALGERLTLSFWSHHSWEISICISEHRFGFFLYCAHLVKRPQHPFQLQLSKLMS